jgi:hypothetical protein
VIERAAARGAVGIIEDEMTRPAPATPAVSKHNKGNNAIVYCVPISDSTLQAMELAQSKIIVFSEASPCGFGGAY